MQKKDKQNTFSKPCTYGDMIKCNGGEVQPGITEGISGPRKKKKKRLIMAQKMRERPRQISESQRWIFNGPVPCPLRGEGALQRSTIMTTSHPTLHLGSNQTHSHNHRLLLRRQRRPNGKHQAGLCRLTHNASTTIRNSCPSIIVCVVMEPNLNPAVESAPIKHS